MPLRATKDATAYVCGREYSIKQGEELGRKPKPLQAALIRAGVAEETANASSKTKEQR